jgi:hypothetical protein
VVDAPVDAFDSPAAPRSASTADPQGAEDAQRAVRELGITLPPAGKAVVMEFVLAVGQRAVAVGVLEKGDAYRGSGAGGLRDVALVTPETVPELLARLRGEARGLRRVLVLGAALLLVAVACTVIEIVRPGG